MSVPLRDAATVVLLRDGDTGLEVLMGKRSARARFSPCAFVFPGGGVDADDHALMHHCHGVEVARCDARFGQTGALRFYLAAVRELFEEAGIWLFDTHRPEAWEALRDDLRRCRITLASLLETLPDGFDASVLHYYRFWTTPPGAPRRYRTRFFLARAPADQQVQVDGEEFTEHLWARPAEMLDRHQAGEVVLIFPTLRELMVLAEFETVDAAMAALTHEGPVPETRSRHRIENGRLVASLAPGDPGYEDLPGW